MSKTAGNGLDPLDIIESHGADAMRFTLCHMTTQTQDVRMPVVKDSKTGKNTSPKFDMGRNFCNKLWNATRFALSILTTPSTQDTGPRTQDPSLPLVDRWMLSRLHSAVAEVDAALGDYQFATYAQTLYDHPLARLLRLVPRSHQAHRGGEPRPARRARSRPRDHRAPAPPRGSVRHRVPSGSTSRTSARRPSTA